MTGAELARAVANVTWEVLQTLTTALKPWAMEDLASRVGVPPIDLGADWTAAVEQARVDLDGLEGAAWVGRVAALADLLVAQFRNLLDVGSEVELLARLRPFVALALLLAMAKDAERNRIEEAVVWVAAALPAYEAPPSVAPPRIQSGANRCARKKQQAPCRPRRIVGSRSREYWCR